MIQNKKVKCPQCGTLNDKETAIFSKKRYYCKICFDEKTKNTDYYKDLIEYICQLYKLTVPNGWILKQIKEYKEQFNYSYLGMKTTLHYFFEIQGNEADKDMGIGIIPFVYEEAKQFYIDKKAIKENSEQCDIKQIQSLSSTINISLKNSNINDRYRDLVVIDISALGEE